MCGNTEMRKYADICVLMNQREHLESPSAKSENADVSLVFKLQIYGAKDVC